MGTRIMQIKHEFKYQWQYKLENSVRIANELPQIESTLGLTSLDIDPTRKCRIDI